GATLTRTVNDSTNGDSSRNAIWTYARTGTNPTWTTAVTDPLSNQTIINLQGIYETQRVVKQGTTTTLAQTQTCYNGAAFPCNSTAVTLPITRITTKSQVFDSAGSTSRM